jgi:hypothetical protein
MSSTKPASNNKGGLKSPVIPEGLYTNFITQQLKQAYTNSFGEYAYGFIVGNRISQYEKFINKIRADTNCKIFIQLDEKKINIVSSDIDKLAKAIDYIANINNLMKTHGVTIVKETVEFNVKNVNVIFDIVDECITLECPGVAIKVNSSSIDFSGPSQQVRIAVDSFNNIYSRSNVFQTRQTKKEKDKSDNLIEMTPEYREHLKRLVQHIYQDIEYIDPAEYIDEDGELIYDLEYEQPEKMVNYQVKPPSKRSQIKKGSGSNESSKIRSIKDLILDEEQAYARIIKMYGDCKAEIQIISLDDDLTDKSVIGRFPSYNNRTKHKNNGKSYRRKPNKSSRLIKLDVEDIVIISKRDFDNGKVDVIGKVNDYDIQKLVEANIIDGNYKRFLNNHNVAVEDERCNFEFDYNDNCDFNIDDI